MSCGLCLHRLWASTNTRVTTRRRSDARRVKRSISEASPRRFASSVPFSCVEALPLSVSRNFFSIRTKNRRGGFFYRPVVNAVPRPHEKDGVHMKTTICYPTSGVERITGWRLVRTHAAGAARVLPRRATPRPLGASLLAAGASPDRRLLGASLLAAQNRGGGRDALP